MKGAVSVSDDKLPPVAAYDLPQDSGLKPRTEVGPLYSGEVAVQHAIDGYGALVSATKGRRYRRYRCPLCKQRVHLRDGPRRAAHFAHNPGEGDPDCENYHPASGTTFYEDSSDSTRIRASHALYMVIDPALAYRPRWHLEILVPASPGVRGAVRVVDSPHGEVRLQCRELFDGAVRAEVRPQFSEYRLEPMGVSDRRYEERLEVGTSGLAAHLATAFEIGSTVSRRMPEGKPLGWGGSYALVWPEQLPLPSPPHATWSELAPHRGWEAAILELPTTEFREIQRWADRFLDRPVRHAPPQIGLVSPAVLSIADDGALRIPVTRKVILSVEGEPEASSLVFSSPSGTVQRLPVWNSDPKLFAFSDLPIGRTEFYLDDPDSDDLMVEVLAAPVCTAPSAEFLFRGPGLSGEDSSVPVFSKELPSRLKRVREGELDLIGLTCPPGLHCRIRSRDSSASPWRELAFAEPRNTDDTTACGMDDVVSYLRSSLRSPEIELDFGSFGGVVLHRRSVKRSTVAVPSTVRDRILWLLSIPGGDVPAHYCLGRARSRWRKSAVQSWDRAILTELFDRELWPAAMLPHLTTTDHELVRVFQKAE